MWKHLRWQAVALCAAAMAAGTAVGGCAEADRPAVLEGEGDEQVAEAAAEIGGTVTIRPFVSGSLSNDDNFVYFTQLPGEFCSGFDSVLGRININSGSLIEFYRACDAPNQAVPDGTSVYFLEWNGDDVRRIDTTTETNTKVTDTTGSVFHRGLKVNATHAFWADDTGIRRVPKAGGVNQTLVASTGITDNMSLLGIDASFVYFTRQNSSTSFQPVLFRVPLAGGAPTQLAGSTERFFAGFSIDASFLYWYADGVGIRRMPKAGGAPVTIATTRPTVDGIAVNNNYVFWSQRASTATNAPGEIMSYNKATGIVTTSKGGLTFPNYVGLTSTQLLWRDGDALRKAALPRCGDGVCSDGETCGSCATDCLAFCPLAPFAVEGPGEAAAEAAPEELTRAPAPRAGPAQLRVCHS